MKVARNRTALTLIELLFALFMATAFIDVGVATSRLLASENSSTRHLESIVSLSQLGEQLRRDVHSASNVRVEQLDGQPLRVAPRIGG